MSRCPDPQHRHFWLQAADTRLRGKDLGQKPLAGQWRVQGAEELRLAQGVRQAPHRSCSRYWLDMPPLGEGLDGLGLDPSGQGVRDKPWMLPKPPVRLVNAFPACGLLMSRPRVT